MNRGNRLSEKGQTLVLVVIGFLVFVAMLALVLDGGNAYAAKRQAQNAADAGALAGATYLCTHRNEADAVTLAEAKAVEYANLNGALEPPPEVDADIGAAAVVVTATVTKDTFFAGIIGFNEVAPRAVAKAECRPPAVGVLPVAWSCRENVVGEVICNENVGPCRPGDENNTDPLDTKGLNCTYVLMDSVKVKTKGKPCKDPNLPPEDPDYCYVQNDIECASPEPNSDGECIFVADPDDPTIIDCDLDNDCTDELMAGGARSWLDLDGGGGGANELVDWISGAEDPPELDVHTWIPEESGVATSIFHATANYLVGNEVILPVFNKVCDGLPETDDPETSDQCNAGSGDDQSIITSSTLNFHIISFSAFHVTCVQTGKNKVTAEAGYFVHPSDKDCYGHAAAVAAKSIDDNDKSIEGYFVRENLGGYGGPGDWYDTGTFTVILVPFP
jgi:hypothetical protein